MNTYTCSRDESLENPLVKVLRQEQNTYWLSQNRLRVGPRCSTSHTLPHSVLWPSFRWCWQRHPPGLPWKYRVSRKCPPEKKKNQWMSDWNVKNTILYSENYFFFHNKIIFQHIFSFYNIPERKFKPWPQPQAFGYIVQRLYLSTVKMPLKPWDTGTSIIYNLA